MKRTGLKAFIAIAAVAIFSGNAERSSAAIIFADFNVNEGTFNSAPNASGTTNFNTGAGQSAYDRTTTDSFEGAGSELLDLVHNTPAGANRARFLSGAGTPANNTSFTTSAGTDGFIGYYYKVIGDPANAVGTTMSINLDGPGNTAAEYDGGTPKPINADGLWHLAEWNLDLPADWGVVTGIGGGHGVTGLPNVAHTIDSIYLQGNTSAVGAHFQILIDFVAKSDSGSIADLVPEPTSFALVGIALLGICGGTRRRIA
jgi:hypothetical protein